MKYYKAFKQYCFQLLFILQKHQFYYPTGAPITTAGEKWT